MALSTIPFSGLGADASNQGVNFRNLIINGDMSIAQRGTSFALPTSGTTYTLDRMKHVTYNLGAFTVSQSTDTPTGQGFAKSYKVDCTTADASPVSSDQTLLQHRIEGQMLQHLKKGTSNAESLTLSFWVKSNKTGTYIAELYDRDNTRTISKSYTISSSATWEKKTITFDADTTGTLDNDNNVSLDVHWWLGGGTDLTSGTLQTTWGTPTQANRLVGQVNLADNTANEWYITGVQLEVGTSASDFEFLPHDVNLQRCMRYFEMLVGTNGGVIGYGYGSGSDTARTMWQFKVQKRAVPSMSDSYSTSRQYRINFTSPDGTAVNQNSSNTPGFGDISVNNSGYMNLSGFSSIGGGHNGFMIYNNTTTAMGADAEL